MVRATKRGTVPKIGRGTILRGAKLPDSKLAISLEISVLGRGSARFAGKLSKIRTNAARRADALARAHCSTDMSPMLHQFVPPAASSILM